MKIWIGCSVLLIALGASASAHAASFCGSASSKIETDALADSLAQTPDPNLMNKLMGYMKKCQVGDVVSIPTNLSYLLVKYCDFSKSIISLPQTVADDPNSAATLCVVGEPKGDD